MLHTRSFTRSSSFVSAGGSAASGSGAESRRSKPLAQASTTAPPATRPAIAASSVYAPALSARSARRRKAVCRRFFLRRHRAHRARRMPLSRRPQSYLLHVSTTCCSSRLYGVCLTLSARTAHCLKSYRRTKPKRGLHKPTLITTEEAVLVQG